MDDRTASGLESHPRSPGEPAVTAGTSFIDLRHVTVCRGTTPVLHDLSFQVAPGESVAILGPNGCGKSTLLKVLTCELYPLAQADTRVEIFGRSRWDVQQLRRRMGVVTAEPLCRDALSVSGFEAVLTGFFSSARLWPHLQVTDTMRQCAEQAMADAGVAHLRDQPLHAMSSGQQKRISIARALAAAGDGMETPRVLVLDEPSNALDIVAQRELRTTVEGLAGQGKAVLLVTHHVEDIPPAIRRTVLLKAGRVVADGPTPDLLTSERLSDLFGASVELRVEGGAYFAR